MWFQPTSAFVVFINHESFQLLLYLWTHVACRHLCRVHLTWLLSPGGEPVSGHPVRLFASGGGLNTAQGPCGPWSWATYYVDWFHFLLPNIPGLNPAGQSAKVLGAIFPGRMKRFCSSFILGAIFPGTVPRDLRGRGIQSKVIIALNEVTSCLWLLCCVKWAFPRHLARPPRGLG